MMIHLVRFVVPRSALIAAVSVCVAMPSRSSLLQQTRLDVPNVDTIRGVAPGTSLRWPSLAVRKDTVYVATNVFRDDGSVSTPPHAFLLARVPGLPLSPPPGEFAFAYPQLLSRTEGGLDLFWGEFDKLPSTPRDWMRAVTSLWHAEYRNDVWSTPERIADRVQFLWGSEGGQVARTPTGFVIVTPASLGGGAPVLMQVSGATGRWTSRSLALTANYASVIATGDRALVAAYVAPNVAVPGDRGTVFVIRSADLGMHWREPEIVSAAGSGIAFAPRLAAAGNVLDLVWGRGRGSLSLESLVRRRSTDRGKTWGDPHVVSLRSGSRAFHIAASPCNDVGVVELFRNGQLQIDRLTWSASATLDSSQFTHASMAASPGVISSGSKSAVAFNRVADKTSVAVPVLTRIGGCS
jgi:hypothetical protein